MKNYNTFSRFGIGWFSTAGKWWNKR